MKIQFLVMLASKFVRMPTETSTSNLDSSTPCWNDGIERFWLELTEAPLPRIFEGVSEGHEEFRNYYISISYFVLFASFVVKPLVIFFLRFDFSRLHTVSLHQRSLLFRTGGCLPGPQRL